MTSHCLRAPTKEMKTDSITWQHTHNLLAHSQHLASHLLQDRHHSLVMQMNQMTPFDVGGPTCKITRRT